MVGNNGYTDTYTELLPVDDAATHANPNDRMPSKAEWEELISLSYRQTVTSYNGVTVNGCIVYKAKDVNHRGKKDTLPLGTYSLSDTHIFLPGGWSGNLTGASVYYWSKSMCTKNQFPSFNLRDEYCAQAYLFSNGDNGIVYFGRFYGFRARPVREQNPND